MWKVWLLGVKDLEKRGRPGSGNPGRERIRKVFICFSEVFVLDPTDTWEPRKFVKLRLAKSNMCSAGCPVSEEELVVGIPAEGDIICQV